MASGYYRLMNSIKAGLKSVFKDRAKSATREQAEKMLGPRNTTMDIMKRDELIKHGIKPKD